MGFENKCCFCVELRLGSIIFGYLSLVWTIAISVLYILAILDLMGTSSVLVVSGLIEIGAVMLGHSLLRLIFIILLIFGLHTDSRRIINVFFIPYCILLVIGIALFVANMILSTTVIFRTISPLDLFLNIYFMIVIRVYYMKLDNAGSKPVIEHQQYDMQTQQQYTMQDQQPARQQQQQYDTQQQQAKMQMQRQQQNEHNTNSNTIIAVQQQ